MLTRPLPEPTLVCCWIGHSGHDFKQNSIQRILTIPFMFLILQTRKENFIRNTLRFCSHRGRVTHICVGKLTITGSDNRLSPVAARAITWDNVGKLLIGPLGTNFIEDLIGIKTFSFRKINLKCRLWNGDHFVSASMCLFMQRLYENNNLRHKK